MNCHFQTPCISPPSATQCPGHISFPYHAVFGGTLEVSHLQMSLMHSETKVHPFWKWIISPGSYFFFLSFLLLLWCYYEIQNESQRQAWNLRNITVTVCHLSQCSWTWAKSSWYVCMVNFILRINVSNCHNQFYSNIIYMETLGRLWKSDQVNLWPSEVWTEYLPNTSLVHYQC